MRWRRALLAGLLGCLIAAAPASAITRVDVQATMDSELGLRIVAQSQTSGDRTSLRITRESATGAVVVSDESDGASDLVAGGDCQEGANVFTGRPFVRCPRPRLNFIDFDGLGLVNDTVTLEPGAGDCTCDGGGGNDTITGADGADLIRGGPGNDTLRGRDGGDVLEGGNDEDTITTGNGTDEAKGEGGTDILANSSGGGGDGPDKLDGGEGTDTVNYEGRLSGLRVSFDDVANDGTQFREGSEGDNISATVERVVGGAGADRMVGSARPEELLGRDGNDTLIGGSPASAGQSGLDDRLTGGLGMDVMRGEGGVDSLNTADAVDDQVTDALSCGAGSDFLNSDVRDDDTRALPEDCEDVDQGMVGELPNVRIGSVVRLDERSLSIRLRCPRRTLNGCAGKVAVRSAAARGRGGFGPATRYRIRRGRRASVLVRTRNAALARAGANVRVRSVEKGRLGPRTTLRTVVVRGGS